MHRGGRGGRLCIFIPLNKREMRRRRAEDSGPCDRNHIIEQHTESCPSNSPRRTAAASQPKQKRVFDAGGVRAGEKVRLGAPQQSCRFPLCGFSSAPPLFASPTGETMADGNRGAEIPSGSIIPRFQVQQMSFVFL